MADDVSTVEIPESDPEAPTQRIESVSVPTDPEAPWGLKPDGTPYKVNPERYRKRSARGRSTSGSKSKAKPKTDGHFDAVIGVIQIVSLPVAAAAVQSPVFAADMVAINATAEPIADAFSKLAQSNRGVANALDRLSEVGPYGLVIAAVAPLVLQIARNHGVIGDAPGTVDPAVLLGEEPTPVDEAA